MPSWFHRNATQGTSSDKRRLITDDQVRLFTTMLSHGVRVSGKVLGTGGLMIDGEIQASTVETSDQSPIAISVRGIVSNSVIHATDLLIEGKANAVVITARRKIEFGPSSVVVGTLYKGPNAEMYVAPTADIQDLTIKPLQESVQIQIPESQPAGLLKDGHG